jgi:hypothetical protein
VIETSLRGEPRIASLAPIAEVETLAAGPADTNSLAAPTKVVPVSAILSGIKPGFTFTMPPHSIFVLRLGVR